MTVLSIATFFFVPKNLGIDMTGGLQIEYSVPQAIDSQKLDIIREEILQDYSFENKKIISDLLLYSVNGNSIRTDIGLASEKDVLKASQRTEDLRAKIPSYFKKE